MNRMLHSMVEFLRSEDGPSAVEYATLLGLIAAAAIGALTAFGGQVDALYVLIRGAL